jgi:hypothetical protein
LFAYPYSADSKHSNDPAAAAYARSAMLRTFDATFLDDTYFRYNEPGNRAERTLMRFDVGESAASIVFDYLTLQPAPQGYGPESSDANCMVEVTGCPNG